MKFGHINDVSLENWDGIDEILRLMERLASEREREMTCTQQVAQ